MAQHFGGFFRQIKGRQPKEREGFYTTVCRRSRRLEAFLYLAAQNFELFSNIQDKKLKNQKPIAVDVLFKAYPMASLS
jgi:hypothetical protein